MKPDKKNHIKTLMATLAVAMFIPTLGYGQSAPEQSKKTPPYKVALVVQNHADNGARIPMAALTDALTAKISGPVFQVINPYNVVGVNQNRTVVGEKTPAVSATELAKKLNADGLITASVIEFRAIKIGKPAALNEYSVRVAFNLADAQTGAAICGETIKVKSPKYTNHQVSQNRDEYLGELLYSAAEKCAEYLKQNPNVKAWVPSAPKPRPPRPIPLPSGPLSISDIDGAVQKLIAKMRIAPVFRSNYDKAQKAIDGVPLVIVGGIVDMTGGKSRSEDFGNLLAAGSQGVRMTLMNSGLFEAKDDALVTTITDRIIKNGNSPLEDGELMSALKQHGSPDFFVVGDMMYFADKGIGKYRLRLAMHNLHTGKIVFEDTHMILKKIGK